MRKQTNSKSIKRHMQNGGMNSFNFHGSPRMVRSSDRILSQHSILFLYHRFFSTLQISHAIRPEVQFVKMSIKQFVRPGKKVKDDHTAQTTSFKKKLTDVETKLLLKYFHPCEDTWRPSLIAFPHFQTFPSRTHAVMHSSRTMVLIDTMQHLEGLHFSRDSEAISVEVCFQVLF